MNKIMDPYGPKILLEVLPVKEQPFKITGDDADKPIRGKILAIGELKNDTLGLKLGDIIMYDYYSSVEYHQMDQEFLIIHEDDILGRVKKEEEDGSKI